MRATFRELLDRSEQHVRGHFAGDERDRMLRDIEVFRRSADFEDERHALHGFEKFLHFALWYTRGDERLRAALTPYVTAARHARERLGGDSLLSAGQDEHADSGKR